MESQQEMKMKGNMNLPLNILPRQSHRQCNRKKGSGLEFFKKEKALLSLSIPSPILQYIPQKQGTYFAVLEHAPFRCLPNLT